MLRVLLSVLQQIRLFQVAKSVAESRELFYFSQQSLYMLRVLPAQGKLVLQQVTLLPCNFIQPRPQGFSLKKWVGREKALASASHVSPRTP